MNDEFQWRTQLGKLRDSVQPERDLWPQIDTRLQAPHRHRRLIGVALVASAAIIGLTSVLMPRFLSPRSSQVTVAASARTSAQRGEPLPIARTPLDWAVPKNPALAAAAHDLDDASAQLQRALEQHPDAVFLVGLLNRTNAQRMRLLREPFTG